MLKFLPGKSINTQLISLVFGLTAIAIIVLGFLAIKGIIDAGVKTSEITSRAMTERVEQFLVQTTTATAAKNSLLFKTVEQKTANAAETTKNILQHPEKFSSNGWYFDSKVTRLPTGQYTNSKNEVGSVFLPSLSPVPEGVKREFEITSYLDYIFPQIIASEPNAVALYFTGYRNTARYYPNIGLASITPPDFTITEQEFFTVANPKNDPEKITKWTAVYDDPAGHGLTITAAHPIYLDDDSFAGTIGMDVTLTNIAKNIEDYSPIQDSYAFLIDKKGRAIAFPKQGYHDLLGREPKKNEFGTELKDVKGDFANILLQMRQGKKGFTAAKANGTDVYIAYVPVQETNFSLGIVARKDTMLQVVTDLKKQVFLSTLQTLYSQVFPASITILLLVWFLGFLYIRLITEPIKHLTTQIALVASGNFAIEPTKVKINNEVGQLADSFSSMVGELQESRKKIEEQNKELLRTEQTRLKASINSLNLGFIMTGTNNEIIMLNGVAKQILLYEKQGNDTVSSFGSNKEHFTTDEIDTLFGEVIAFKKNLDNTLRTGIAYEQTEIDFKGKILRIFMAPIQQDDTALGIIVLGVVVLIEDITDVKMLERSKDEFFSIASHELRTPLTAVRGNAALLKQVYSEKIHEHDFDDMVNDIHDASVRLIGIVNDFLDATRLEQGKIKFENAAFNIEETLKTVVYEMSAIAKEKGNILKIGEGVAHLPTIFADKNRVKQIVYNLVGNAMKFTEKGTITIDTHINYATIQVLISDTGPGISEENQRLLFHKFHQVGGNPLTRDAARGTGLGLYISKLLSEQMGGSIALEHSEIGRGTTFSFTLPLQPKTSVA